MRPHKTRRVGRRADVTYFKPQGVPMRSLEEADLPRDCLEAMRLADVEGLYHQEAAERMGISRATFGRILVRGRSIVAEALIEGKALSIGGGPVRHVRPDSQESGDMPGQDGKGPRGEGQRSGRGLGPCGSGPENNETGNRPGRGGRGRGQGPGQGQGQGRRRNSDDGSAGRGAGRGRGGRRRED